VTGTGGAAGAAGASATGGAAGSSGAGGKSDASAGSGGASDAGSDRSTSDGGPFGLCAPLAYPSCNGLAPIASADLCAGFAQAFCGIYKRCNLLTTAAYNVCVTNRTADCQNVSPPHGFASVTAGRADYDGAAAACCLKHLETDVACASLISNYDVNDDPACRGAFKGKVLANGSCYSREDCAAGYCNKNNSCPGVCKPFTALGSTCTGKDECGPQASCMSVGEGGTVCTPNRCQDAPCGKGLPPCDEGLVCRTQGQGSTCQPPPKLGDSCGVDTLTCDLQTSSCDLTVTFSDGGTPMISGQCVAQGGSGVSCLGDLNCQPGFYCKGANPPTKGTCAASPALGGACDPTATDKVCGPALKCQPPDDKCGFSPLLGDKCVPTAGMTTDNCDSDLYCDTGMIPALCMKARPGGAGCLYGKQCASQTCAQGLCTDPCDPP
jgi:hypothetical protein